MFSVLIYFGSALFGFMKIDKTKDKADMGIIIFAACVAHVCRVTA